MVRAGELQIRENAPSQGAQDVVGFQDRIPGVCREHGPPKVPGGDRGAPGMASHKWSVFVLSLKQGSQAGRARECREGGRGSMPSWGGTKLRE